MPGQNWQFELEEYIKQGEPDRTEKSEAWQTAIGLQAVDGLNTSAYLLDTAKDHIEGKITIDEAQQRIHSYYEQRIIRTEIESETKEADIVSARIAKLLGEKAFQFSPAEWLSIHRRLFEGVFSHAGQVRQYNITKKEWVLNGDTVIYADWNSIKDTLDYDFATEKQFSYEGLSVDAAVKHLAKFASDIWQIHPFGEGNTRATAVFIIKYMKTFGFRVNNDAFEKNSWYFRNALVRANYTNLQKGVHSTTKFLEMFFSNLLLGTDYELKNRYMHIDYVEGSRPQSINSKVPKYQFDTLDCSLEELAVLELVAQNPAIKQQELVNATGRSIATVKRIMKSLQDKSYIRRESGKRYGKWEVLVRTIDHSKRAIESENKSLKNVLPKNCSSPDLDTEMEESFYLLQEAHERLQANYGKPGLSLEQVMSKYNISQKAFEQSEKEVSDLHQRTKEGIETARLSGKQIGLRQGQKLTTKKSIKAKEVIQKHSVDFGGTLADTDVIKLAGLSRNTYYKYKRELREASENNNES